MYLALTEATSQLGDADMRKLLSGKTVEALTWFLGNKGVTYSFYKRLSVSMNHCLIRLNEPKYPSYGTMLRRSSQLFDSHAFIRRFEFFAEVNTSRSGVSHRFVQERRAGGTPMQKVFVILPSDWARKDILQYEFLLQTIRHPSRFPKCVYIDHAPILDTDKRQSIDVSLNELYSHEELFTFGHNILSGDRISLRLNGTSEDMHRLFHNDPDVKIQEGIGYRYAILWKSWQH